MDDKPEISNATLAADDTTAKADDANNVPDIKDDLRSRGFTSPLPPQFTSFKKPEGFHYLDLYLEKNPEGKETLHSHLGDMSTILKKHGASQALGDELGNFLYQNFNEDSKKMHKMQEDRAQKESVRLEYENTQKTIREGEEYRKAIYESERRENLEKTAEWQKAKKLFDAKMAKGNKEFSSEELGDLAHNETVIKLAAELSDLRLARDKDFFPAPKRTSEEQSAFEVESFRKIWANF